MAHGQEPGLSREAIASDVRALGLAAGSLVLVHSSLRSLGWVEGGAPTVIDALLETVSPGGTVVVPTLTGTIQDGPEHPPVFDPGTTRCWTGTIPETFRRLPSARRSRHPTHSVAAVGPATAWLIAGHEYCATPCAADSPYGRLADAGGFILLLGVTHDCNTSLHMIEELAGVPYHMQREPAPARVARRDGAWEEIPTRLHLWHWERDFPRVEPLLLEAGAQRTGMVGQARSRLVDARAMRDLLLALLRRDPLFLLSDAARAAYEQSSTWHLWISTEHGVLRGQPGAAPILELSHYANDGGRAMPRISDQTYLLARQYQNGSNLEARIALHARFSVNTYGWYAWLFDRLHLPPQSRVLELGCGTGRLWLENVHRIPEGWDVTLSDFSPGMVQEAQQNLRHSRRPFAFAVIDAQAIPYEDESLDGVIANHMLYHVPDRPKALAEIRRVLRPGGKLYAATNGQAHLRELNRFVPERETDFGQEHGFNLENGRDELAPWFSTMIVHRYDDALVITEAEPLIAYFLSTRIASALDDEARADLARRVEQELAAHGAIHVTKDSGLFEACKGA